MQIKVMREYIRNRKWNLAVEFQEVGSGAKTRPKREELLKMARRREIDAILVWKLDRFGRSLVDPVTSLNELRSLNVVFVSLTESRDFSTPSGRAMAGMLSTFAEFDSSVKLLSLDCCPGTRLWLVRYDEIEDVFRYLSRLFERPCRWSSLRAGSSADTRDLAQVPRISS